jgi:hypothetical protein
MKITFWAHAVQRMFERTVSLDEVHAVLSHCETIEDYPNETPYPSRLVLGWIHGRPLHVVAASNKRDDETIIVTVYEPDPAAWDSDFRMKSG